MESDTGKIQPGNTYYKIYIPFGPVRCKNIKFFILRDEEGVEI